MTDFSRIALIWGENHSASGPVDGPGISVSRWSAVTGQPWLRFNPSEVPDLSMYDTAVINLFHTPDSVHAVAIREKYPDIRLVVAPDPSLDLVLSNPGWMNMYQQMQAADLIAGRTFADCETYGTLLNKETFYLPSPIGPSDWYEGLRDLSRDDYLLTLDHAFAPANTILNVAAVAAIQRVTGIRVLYAAERDWTKQYAEFAGLKAEWLGGVGGNEFAILSAKAKIATDIYASHAIGRFGILCAAVGTPCISSSWTSETGHPVNDPFEPKYAPRIAARLLSDTQYYEMWQRHGYKKVDRQYSFRASQATMEGLLAWTKRN